MTMPKKREAVQAHRMSHVQEPKEPKDKHILGCWFTFTDAEQAKRFKEFAAKACTGGFGVEISLLTYKGDPRMKGKGDEAKEGTDG